MSLFSLKKIVRGRETERQTIRQTKKGRAKDLPMSRCVIKPFESSTARICEI